MDQFFDKRIILIVPKFYGYEDYIKAELVRRGAKVEIIYDDLKELNFFFKVAFRCFPNQKAKICEQYYRHKSSIFNKSVDYIFVVKGASLTKNIIREIKKSCREDAKYILYLWDSVNNNKDCIDLTNEFDEVLTFDSQDASKYDWKYRPLFYIPSLCVSRDKKIDILYTGVVHSKRMELVRKIENFSYKNHLDPVIKLYIKKTDYYKRKYLNRQRAIQDIEGNKITFKPMDIKDMYRLYTEAKIVVDFANPNQSGLTMRTIECFGNNCKILTNNKSIKSEPIFNPANIFVYDDEFEVPHKFINQEFEQPPKDLLKKYSLDKWIDEVFEKC